MCVFVGLRHKKRYLVLYVTAQMYRRAEEEV